jgi:hypothetical protein
MDWYTHILALLLTLAPWHADRDEDPAARAERLSHVARGVAVAADLATCEGEWSTDPECTPAWPPARKTELLALLISQGWWESRYARHVHEGRCRTEIGECDGGMARSPWQIQRSALVPAEEWRQMDSADSASTEIAARASARILAVGRSRCGSAEGAIASYATGKSCRWSPAATRLRHARRIEADLTRARLCADNPEREECSRAE